MKTAVKIAIALVIVVIMYFIVSSMWMHAPLSAPSSADIHETYSSMQKDMNSRMLSGYTPSYNYKIQYPQNMIPSASTVGGIAAIGGSSSRQFAGDYPVWDVVDGVQQMRIGDTPYHYNNNDKDGNLNPKGYKQYGWRSHQYTGNPFKIHRWYNDPATMVEHWPATPLNKPGSDYIWGDENLTTAVSHATGYDDNVDNEGVDGNFQYPDTSRSHISNFGQSIHP